MSRELFNFIWVAGQKANTIHIGADVDRVQASVHEVKDAVILYPSLFTPSVYVRGRATPVVELLIACKEELSVRDVNVHLKISAGLDPEKPYDPRPLFLNPDGLIVLEKTKANDDGILHTHRRFSGILAEQVQKLYAPYSHIYKVSVSDAALPSRLPPRVEKLSSRMTVAGLPNAIVGQEAQDVSIASFLEDAGEQGDNAPSIAGARRYGFKVNSDDGTVDLSQPNPEEPIQSYHPLFVWSAEHAVANFGHVSDIHVNARLNMLRRSPACVVEDPQRRSPEVQTLLVDTNDSFASVLGQMRQDPTVDALAIGGDLIDHIRNAYKQELFDTTKKPTIGDIWGAVDLADEETLHDRYPAGVDYLLFYSMIVDFCRRSSKPLFGISGNHDTYEEPFGISPRVFNTRANAGIPADLNLTLYEALLSFGPTWATVVKEFNFNEDWWVWFYRVFGAFNDFVVRLPTQTVVALGWGQSEAMLERPLKTPQGTAHLPRSDNALTRGQLSLLELPLHNSGVLFTHFTLASFREEIPMVDEDKRRTTGELSTDFTLLNMGTFELHRARMVELIKQGTWQVAIAGHSHRRATYQITNKSKTKFVDNGYGIPVEVPVLDLTMHDTRHVGGKVSGFMPPTIVVSDAAGPMPRLNLAGELGQWGSDVAGGTLATFAPDARLASLGVVSAEKRPRPRAVVALDYLDIEESQVFSSDIVTDWFDVKKEQAAIGATPGVALYQIRLPVQPKLLADAQISVRSFTLHGALRPAKAESSVEWVCIELTQLDTRGRPWGVPASQTKAFHDLGSNPGETIIGLTFDCSHPTLKTHYNWKDVWYFEVRIERRNPGRGHARFSLKRPSRAAPGGTGTGPFRFRDVPDFQWRMENLSKPVTVVVEGRPRELAPKYPAPSTPAS